MEFPLFNSRDGFLHHCESKRSEVTVVSAENMLLIFILMRDALHQPMATGCCPCFYPSNCFSLFRKSHNVRLASFMGILRRTPSFGLVTATDTALRGWETS